ncbi:MAG TPA: hypothetical protein PLA50_07090 [Bacteroidia bacterium]|nr:hypothetical protein [Bacteroidia bacterium]
MTAQQLESLLIDQALGELSDEASALLETYLANFPERIAEAERVRQAVGLTGAAVAARPLALEPETEAVTLAFPRKERFPAVMRIAAAVALLGLAVGAGFLAGNAGRGPDAPREAVVGSEHSAAPSPWARYHVEADGRLAVVATPDPNS